MLTNFVLTHFGLMNQLHKWEQVFSLMFQ